MSNLLYRCALNGDLQTKGDEPIEVLLRIYGPQYSDVDLQLEIFKQLARENLGPRLYATFKEGRIEEYFPSSPLMRAEMTDDDISAVIAKKLAAIHRLEVEPIKRNQNWLIDKYNELYEFVLASRGSFKCNDDMRDSTKAIALEMLAIDFQPEIDFLTHLFATSDAPLVFSHNDLHQNNILLLHGSDKKRGYEDHIVLIDFEYCSYNYRIFDAANHLTEWCFEYNGDEYPFFSASTDWFPSEEQQKKFLGHYLSQFGDTGIKNGYTTNGDDKGDTANGIEALFSEMQPFLMAPNLLWALWAIKSACTSEINFGYWVSRGFCDINCW